MTAALPKPSLFLVFCPPPFSSLHLFPPSPMFFYLIPSMTVPLPYPFLFSYFAFPQSFFISSPPLFSFTSFPFLVFYLPPFSFHLFTFLPNTSLTAAFTYSGFPFFSILPSPISFMTATLPYPPFF